MTNSEEPNVSYPVIMEDDPIHTEEHRFCSDSSCDCHEDHTLIASVADQILDGLLTAEEATTIVKGYSI